MNIGLRVWLLIIGLIDIAAIFIDGWRRYRGSKNKPRLDGTASFYSETPKMQPTEPANEPPATSSAPEKKPPQEPTLSAIEPMTTKVAAKKEQQFSLSLSADNEQQTEAPSIANTPKSPATDEAVEEVLIINVVCNQPEGFKGPALLQNILESGLRFGEMDIFHRHESMTGNGERYFSMANGVKPGTFDLDDIDHFTTKAVSFFLGIPGPKHPKRAFDVMLAAARKLSSELDGKLLDEKHSVITAQTIAHYRQRITDFERRKLTKKK